LKKTKRDEIGKKGRKKGRKKGKKKELG